jgi:hypothetical protein
MGAYIDHTGGGRFLFGWKKDQPKRFGAVVMQTGGWSLMGHMLDDSKRTWAVCPHLSDPRSLAVYYMASGSIMVLLGKCLCHDCYEMIRSSGDLTGFLNSCQLMTDRDLQEDFIDPLIRVNRYALKTKGSTRHSWVCCPHVAREGQLGRIYQGCGPIFFHEGHVSCNECREVLPSVSSFFHAMTDCEMMNDDLFQQKIVDQLYPLNREVLKAVRRQIR